MENFESIIGEPRFAPNKNIDAEDQIIIDCLDRNYLFSYSQLIAK
jgi:hypothetical protein